jgi:hypothetical protein
MKVKLCLTIFITHVIKVSIHITDHQTSAILHDNFFSVRKFISTWRIMLLPVGCCECHFYCFYIMNISVRFLEKVKIDMFYSFLYFINVIHFFVQSSQDPHLWVEWLPPTFYSILIFAWSSHLASVLMLLHNLSLLHWRVILDHFSDRFRPLWHTCNHSPRDYGQVPDNWLIFVDYLLVIHLH